ncbi:hypothetical protein PanWU01x14_046130 [Parasponia andersonii]|uniref:Uncharacterized protein n=1 Tax=Parasponia andersonii TaxID=3476 RepID=A0A2P5DNP9_PARAD|nr:hypothetical protein PanWU01x14_046130 [Parasponia andersonii]
MLSYCKIIRIREITSENKPRWTGFAGDAVVCRKWRKIAETLFSLPLLILATLAAETGLILLVSSSAFQRYGGSGIAFLFAYPSRVSPRLRIGRSMALRTH